MSLKIKGHADCQQVTLFTAFFKRHFIRLTSQLKPIILTLVTWGLCPIGLAEWVIHCGEQNNE